MTYDEALAGGILAKKRNLLGSDRARESIGHKPKFVPEPPIWAQIRGYFGPCHRGSNTAFSLY
jgi:hypothetical protein